MTTVNRLYELEAQGVLQRWSSPLQPVEEPRRRFWVNEAVKQSLEQDPWAPLLGVFGSGQRRVKTHALVNTFVAGVNITCGRDGSDVDLKCVRPVMRIADWRIWALRPSAGSRLTRIFGAFAAKDDFVALKMRPRTAFFDYEKEAAGADAEWLRLFPGKPPLHYARFPDKPTFCSNVTYVK